MDTLSSSSGINRLLPNIQGCIKFTPTESLYPATAVERFLLLSVKHERKFCRLDWAQDFISYLLLLGTRHITTTWKFQSLNS